MSRDARPGDAGPVQARTLLYQRALSIPVESMLIGNLRAATEPIEERLGVAHGIWTRAAGRSEKTQRGSAGVVWADGFAGTRNSESAGVVRFVLSAGLVAAAGQGRWDGFARLSRESRWFDRFVPEWRWRNGG